MTSTREITDLRARLQLALGTGYQVGEEVGRGGMSRVFAVRDLTLQRDIVVKTLPPELGGEISVERFKREIHFAASLQHPHIVPVHAAGDVDGLPYYTMPRVDGESLRDRLNRVQRLPLSEVLTVMRDLGRALAYAHRRGLVHRDIKPENILIAEGMAVVTDFGIAKAVAAARRDEPTGESRSHSAAGSTGLTAVGTYLGTPNYVAPEQMTSDATIDHRADLFAFGVVAYELLCGATPFSSRRGAVSGAEYAIPPRDIAAQRLDVAPVVAQLVMQCLAIDPNARPESADQIVRKLDAAMSATPLAPAGDDPSVTRKAFAWYAVAFVLATGLAWVAMIGLGLPDWVFPGAMIVMALGLPVVTTAALARRAAAFSSLERVAEVSRVGWLFTPGPMTIRLAQALTWRRVLAGGGVSLGAFGVLVAGFMLTRALGIGPAGSLLAKGQIIRNQPILIADFTSAPGDSNIARMAREAVSIGLQESNVVSVMPPQAVADALGRMRRETTNQLSMDVARDLAIREGVGLIAGGEVTRDNNGLLLTVRLVAADSGNVLATSQASAVGTADLLSAFERLTDGLRGKMGESLKRVRSSTPLAKATTASFDALLLYTLGARAYDVEANLPKARELLLRAIELDSTFATAWRKYYIVIGYLRAPQGGWKPTRREALEAAFRHRANLPVPERLSIEGNYYWNTNLSNNRPRALAAYDEIVRRTGRPVHNHAWFLIGLHQFARSESLFREIVAADTMARLSYKGLMWALMNQGKEQEADSVGRVVRDRFGDEQLKLERIFVRCGMRDFQTCEEELEAAVRERPSGKAFDALAEIALVRGQLDRWYRLSVEAVRTARGEWFPGATLARNALVDITIRHRPRDAIARLDSINDAVERVMQGPHYARAGQVDSAESLLNVMATNSIGVTQGFYVPFFGPDTALRGWGLAMRRYVRANVAAARGDWRSAVNDFRTSALQEDGLPRPNCATCVTLEIGIAFDRAGLTDSAIVFFEEFLAKPQYNPDPADNAGWMGFLFWKFVNEAWIHERLGELYERTGDRQSAVRHLTAFTELWKDADPELQPRVTAARSRMAQLKAS